MTCQRCGRCCYSAVLCLNIPIEDEKEIGRWLSYHRCDPLVMKSKDGKSVLGVRIPLVCSQLEYKDGKFNCKIYEQRPEICKEYECSKGRIL